MRPLPGFVVCACLLLQTKVEAEFPALESALAEVATQVSEQVGDQPVWVAVRNVTGLTPPWRVAEAIQTELVAGLLTHKADARDAGHDERLDFLAKGTEEFKPSELQRVGRFHTEGLLLLGHLLSDAGAPVLSLTLHDLTSNEDVWTASTKLSAADLAITPNTPPLNQKVVQSAASQIGEVVGNRSSWALAAAALKEAGVKRDGIYDYGRALGPLEAIIPGDVLQFEGVRFHETRGKRRASMMHHTAIVEQVTSPTDLEILHQAYNGKAVSRYTLHLDELREGMVIAYRPNTGQTVLPDAFPLRKHPPEASMPSGGSVNLLRMIDPRLDCVHGIWHAYDGPLKSVRENYSRLQIPYDVPETYTLRLRVRRAARNDVFSIGLVVGGHQTMLAIDAYGGETTGLHRLDGKRARDNESTRKVRVLPPETWVELECRVTPGSVTLTADGESILEWNGDASRLSLDAAWSVPNNNWLFLGSHDNVFEISRLTLSTP